MRFSVLSRTRLCVLTLVVALCLGSSWTLAQSQPKLGPSSPGGDTKTQGCPKDDSGLKLPAGFCATVFADGIGHARHIVVAPNGVVYVNTWSGDYYDNAPTQPADFWWRCKTRAVRARRT